jgi:hypothetical protein
MQLKVLRTRLDRGSANVYFVSGYRPVSGYITRSVWGIKGGGGRFTTNDLRRR